MGGSASETAGVGVDSVEADVAFADSVCCADVVWACRGIVGVALGSLQLWQNQRAMVKHRIVDLTKLKLVVYSRDGLIATFTAK